MNPFVLIRAILPARGVRTGLGLWVCAGLLSVGFVVWHASAVDRYLERVTQTRFSTEELATPLRQVPQSIAADGQVWIQHTLALAEGGDWRLRSTEMDNAPEGRPIYWNSGWALWLEACGRLRKLFTGESLPSAIEKASLWANLPVFILVQFLASFWVWRRWGGLSAALVSIALAGHRGFYTGFYPAYCDHHGLINLTVLGVVLGSLFAGGGWWRKAETRAVVFFPKSETEVLRAMAVSSVFGAFGLWISAASLVITIGSVGFAGALMAFMLPRKDATDLVCLPKGWQLWGRLGAGLSFGFYLLENFPDRLGWRLEVNHPLHGLAWWGAGEIIAAVLAWRHRGLTAKRTAVRILAWSPLVLAAPVLVWCRGVAVFEPMDAFLGRIHTSIHEFLPWWVEIKQRGWMIHGDQIFIITGLLALLGVWLCAKPTREERALVTYAGVLALSALALGVYQNRWLLTASASQIALVLLLVGLLAARVSSGWRESLVFGFGVLLFLPGPWILARERVHVERVRDVQLGETVQLLYRDIAGFLRKSGANGQSIVLSDPNASVGIGYYGGLRTVGTLYWENRDGLLAAAEALSARDDTHAAGVVYARGITHIALVSSYDFLSEYDYALNGGAGVDVGGDLFGRRLLYQHQVPSWLRPLNYRVPAPLAPLGFKVALFKVDFEANESIAYERIGRYQLSLGEQKLAEVSFMKAMAADTSRPEPWLRLGELAVSRQKWTEAINFLRAGIERVPSDNRDYLMRGVVSLLQRQGPAGAVTAQTLLEQLERGRN